jgi:hypothetical protein
MVSSLSKWLHAIRTLSVQNAAKWCILCGLGAT